jgi:hypothetical protein
VRNAAIRRLYDQMPQMSCKGLCQESCGPIAMSTHEDETLVHVGVMIPKLLEGIAALERGHYECPALGSDGRCTVYEDRPMICRLWGAVPEMSCPHGCEPVLDDEQGAKLLRMSIALGGGPSERLWEGIDLNG